MVNAKKCKDNSIEDERPRRSNSTKDPITLNPINQKPRNRCCPYDFDGKFCSVVDDRVLCGFNRNVGKPQSKDSAVYIHGGCRLRDGRLECGYEQGPFTNPRRPPGWDNPVYESQTTSIRSGGGPAFGPNAIHFRKTLGLR